MTEKVETGGLMSFRYSGDRPKISESQREEIREAYEKHDERKRKERRNKIIGWILFLVLVSIVVYFFF